MSNHFLKSRIKLLSRIGAHKRLGKILANLPLELHSFRAGLPFKCLDSFIADNKTHKIGDLAAYAELLLGNQPLLFKTIINGIISGESSHLERIVSDQSLHPLTRFEAVGWSNFQQFGLSMARESTAHLPSMITQYWDSRGLPPEISEGTQEWGKISGFTYELFDETSAAEFIATHFGTSARHQFLSLWHPALQSDLFRLYYLWENGGIYVDADSVPGQAVGKTGASGGESVLLTAMTARPNCATINGFIAAPAKHAFIHGFLEQVLRNLAEKSHERIFWLSGPGALTLFLYKNGGDVRLLPQKITSRDLFTQFDAAYKNTPLNWRVFEHKKNFKDEEILPSLLSEL